jgi:hypothetical protein
MKHSKNNDKDVIKVLKKQMKTEADYNETFLAARRVKAKAEKERETKFEKFKKFQDKQRSNDEMLVEFLTNKKE